MSLLICVVSAFFWSCFDLTRKLCLKNKINSKIILILFSLFQILIFTIWLVFDNFFFNIKSYYFIGILLVLINVSSALLFLNSLRLSELSMTIPLLSFTPLFSAVFSSFLIDETLVTIQYIGIFFIIFGTMILYSRSLQISEIFFSITILRNNIAANYMLLVSLMWSLTPILDKICLQSASINIHGFIQSLGMLIFLLLIYKRRLKNELNILIKEKKLIMITMLIGVSATILQFFAVILSYVSIMESIKRSMGQFGSLFFGKFFFNEKISYQKVFGVTIISFGIFFILNN